MNIQALIFDMDGLMIDTERLYFASERELVAKYGKVVPDSVLRQAMGRSPLKACQIIVREVGLPISGEEFLAQRDILMEHKMTQDLRPMPGLFEILERFNGLLKMAVATGAHRKFLNITLDKLNIRHYFDVLQTSDQLVNGKPHPDIFLHTARKLNVPPESCVVLEDSANGVIAGKSAKCFTIAVPSQFTELQGIKAADFIAKDLFVASDFIAQMMEE